MNIERFKEFSIGTLVESVYDKGTVYRVTEFCRPEHPQCFGNGVQLELVSVGVDTFQYGVSDQKGRMGDGRRYAVDHFSAAKL